MKGLLLERQVIEICLRPPHGREKHELAHKHTVITHVPEAGHIGLVLEVLLPAVV